MKNVCITGKQECAIKDVPGQTVKGNYVKVKIHSAPMCTEFGDYRDGTANDALGHEASGEVVEIDKSTLLKPGDRVVVMPQNACGQCALCLSGNHIHCENQLNALEICSSKTGRATYAQYLIQQDWLLLRIPDGVSYDHASMACCGLGPTFNAVNLMNVNAYDTVLVSGLGPVGLGGVINASRLGAKVIGVDMNPYRRELAKELGAFATINPADKDAAKQLLELTDGRKVDKGIETANRQESVTFLVESTRRKGQLALVSWAGQLNAGGIIANGLTIHGAWHWNHLTHGERMFNVITNCTAKLDAFITHTFPIEKAKDAFELQMSGKCGKVILHPWE